MTFHVHTIAQKPCVSDAHSTHCSCSLLCGPFIYLMMSSSFIYKVQNGKKMQPLVAHHSHSRKAHEGDRCTR